MRLIAAACLWCMATAGNAQGLGQEAYPSQAIRIIVSFQAGTSMDTIARLIGDQLEPSLGKPVVIDNRPGASGMIAEDIVARSAPDGHTLLVTGMSLATVPSMKAPGTAVPIDAFTPVAWLTSQAVAIVANPSLGIDSLAELTAEARHRPGALAYSTNGIGGPAHLAAAILWKQAGVSLTIIPYNGAGALRDLLSGEVPLTFMYLTGLGDYLRNHRLKALAVTSGSRLAAFPDIPTIAEQGYPGFDVTSWFGLWAPAGTSAEIVNRLNAEVGRVLALPEVRKKLASVGIAAEGGTPERLGRHVRAEFARWDPLIKSIGIRPE